MVLEGQAETTRVFTGSKLTTSLINNEVDKISKDIKDSICLDFDAVSKEYDMRYDKASSTVKRNLKTISKKIDIDPASL